MFKSYKKGSHISRPKFREILRLFSEDVNATIVSNITGFSRPAVNRFFNDIRIKISEYCESNSVFADGEIELDESYFGARIVKGKRGRGAGGKIPVFGMLKREGNVYTQIINNCSVAELMPIIEAKASKDSTIYTDCFKSYDGLVDYGYKKHYRC